MGWNRKLWGILLLYVAVVALRTFPLVDWTASMRFDNTVRFWILNQPIETVAHNVREWELAPPFWHYLGNVYLSAVPGDGVVLVRSLNYIMYLAMVPVAYLLGSRVHSPPAGLAAAAIVPWNQHLLDLVLEVSHYPLYAALAAAWTYGIFRAADGALSRRGWVVFSLVTLAYGWTHYWAALHAGTTAGVVVASRALQGADAGFDWRSWPDAVRGYYRDHRGHLHRLVASFVPLGLAHLAWLPSLIQQYRYQPQANVPESSQDILTELLGPFQPHVAVPGVPVLASAALMVALAAAALAEARRKPAVAELVVGAALPWGIVSLLFGAGARHLTFLAPLFPVVAGIGLAGAGRRLTRALRERDAGGSPDPRLVAGLALAVLVAGVGAYGVGAAQIESPKPKTNLKAAVDFARDHVRNDTRVLAVMQWGQLTVEVYGGIEGETVYGIPFNITESPHRIRTGTRTGGYNEPGRVTYNPDARPRDRERLMDLVEGQDRVVIFVVHGFENQLVDPVVADLQGVGFGRTDLMQTANNGVVVLDRNATSG